MASIYTVKNASRPSYRVKWHINGKQIERLVHDWETAVMLRDEMQREYPRIKPGPRKPGLEERQIRMYGNPLGEKKSPCLKKCCLCGLSVENPYIESRPTGNKGILQKWAFCDPTGPNCVTITMRCAELDKIAMLDGANATPQPRNESGRYIGYTEGDNSSQSI
jgi:hypothetical protein